MQNKPFWYNYFFILQAIAASTLFVAITLSVILNVMPSKVSTANEYPVQDSVSLLPLILFFFAILGAWLLFSFLSQQFAPAKNNSSDSQDQEEQVRLFFMGNLLKLIFSEFLLIIGFVVAVNSQAFYFYIALILCLANLFYYFPRKPLWEKNFTISKE